MTLRRLAVACFFASVAALPAPAQQGGASMMGKAEKGGSDDTGPYQPVENWWKPVKEGFIEKGSAVFAESPDRIFFTTSNEFPAPRGGRGGPGGAGGPAPAGAQNMPRV